MFRRLLIGLVILTLVLPSFALAQDDDAAPSNVIMHGDQPLFLSGINIAWIKFARDLKDFDETTWVEILDEVGGAHGNTVRWWLHINGTNSPVYGDDGMVTGLGEDDIKNFRRAVDLAYERGVLVMPVLWSFDMLRDNEGVPVEWNKLLVEDPAYTQAYIDNALTPLVEAMAGHPGIVAWEICNEPEGMSETFGWSEVRTTMPHIQQFTNLLAGAIHRADPDAKVTNGTWNLRVLTDVDDFYNYYTDERLIEAGGDELGTLDFYQAHFYPEHFADDTSPFHNPASHWELDKPLVIGEFPAAGIKDIGFGYRPEGRYMRNSMESYENLYENGYAGALSWSWSDSDFGGLPDTLPGLYRLNNIAPEYVNVELGDLDFIPVIAAPIETVQVTNDTPELTVVNLADVFEDAEDGDDLAYEITENTNPDLITPSISDAGDLILAFVVGPTGSGTLEITVTDTAGQTTSVDFVVQVADPNQGNVAMGKPTTSSTIESAPYAAEYATDGVEDTRWSTEYLDDQWLLIDLEGVFEISQFVLDWETAYGRTYDIQVWDGSAWQTVYSEIASDGDIDDISLAETATTRYIRLHGIERATEWGFSLWEFEANGIKAEGDFADLETSPGMDMAAAEPEPEMEVTDSAVLFDFEDGAQSWEIATDWPQVTATEVVDGTLVMSGAWTADGWNEGGVLVNNDEGWDLSAYSMLTVEICAPEGAVDFFGQIFMKTGDEWTWANNTGGAPEAGACTLYEADLATMGDMTNVKQIGVKIGTSGTEFEGSFTVDNVTVIALTETVEMVPGESTVLFDFEDDAQGWEVATDWPQVTAAEVVDGTLEMSGAWTADGWNEGGALVNNDEGWDLSAYGLLTIEVCAPEGAVEFFGQIFMKTGDDWVWANNPGGAPEAGACTLYEADLATMGDMTNVKQIGVKIGTSGTEFEGSFTVDNITVVTLVEAGTEMGDSAADVPMLEKTMLLYTFENDVDGWVFADYWPAGRKLAVSDEMAAKGDHALKLTGEFSGTAWEEMGVFIDPPDGVDWSAWDTVSVDVYVPAEAEGFIAQIFMKTGDDWAWINTADVELVAGEWNTLVADLSTMGDAAAVKEIGVKIGTRATEFSGAFFIDGVRLDGMEPAPVVAVESMLLYGFEDDLSGWVFADYWTAGTELAQSGEMATEGASALMLSGEFSGTAWEEMGVFIAPPDGADWSMYGAVAVDVYVPAGAEGFLAQIFMKTGDDWAWVNTPDIQLVAGKWNTLVADLSTMGDAAAVKEVGVKIGTSATEFSGAFYVDNVMLAESVDDVKKN